MASDSEKILDGASVILCCYAAIDKRELSISTNRTELKNTNVTFRSAQKCTVEEKISLNLNRFLVNPACIAGVLTSQPNFKAR